MVALGVALRRRGHDVVLAVPSDLVGFARRAGLDAVSAGVDAREFLQSAEGQRWLAAGDSRRYLTALARRRAEVIGDVQDALIGAARGADVIVASRLVEDDAAVLAEHAGVPLVCLHYAPSRPNRVVPPYFLTVRRLPAPVTALAHEVAARVHWRAIASSVNALRARLGLRPVRTPTAPRLARAGTVEIQAYSAALVPRIAGWEAYRPMVGFLGLDAGTRERLGERGVSPDLDRWLDDGDPPVYLGFGSMPAADPDRMLAMVRGLPARVLVGAGWDVRPSRDLFVTGALDHDAVLPRCRAAVHHGGAGTTAAALRAGLPALVCAVFGDQPFWGTRLRALGAGDWMRFADLDARRLHDGVARLLAPEPRAAAARLATRLAAEGGAADRAAELVEARLTAGYGGRTG
ncbi:UDP:flavonoid glycosyltransferase YjiC (YdhE family) [Catenuloplanes atrovinosus]|uniref:UDP:flavonoid glycosyltransferase YjiC (YdhE family) n=2 Tax=Catenuloplanes atrovinosus TaxID=137266 RepID=A0AAE4CAT2_9ACTN|nr:UDP:flavonoid glycosyltransferase YjiC (YdhE family) [Catenuloplanes atrovinosus]